MLFADRIYYWIGKVEVFGFCDERKVWISIYGCAINVFVFLIMPYGHFSQGRRRFVSLGR